MGYFVLMTAGACLIAAWQGWRVRAENAATVREFLHVLLLAYLGSAAWAFAFVLLVFGVVNASLGGAIDLIGTLVAYGTTAFFFVPVTGIAVVARAVIMRDR